MIFYKNRRFSLILFILVFGLFTTKCVAYADSCLAKDKSGEIVLGEDGFPQLSASFLLLKEDLREKRECQTYPDKCREQVAERARVLRQIARDKKAIYDDLEEQIFGTDTEELVVAVHKVLQKDNGAAVGTALEKTSPFLNGVGSYVGARLSGKVAQ